MHAEPSAAAVCNKHTYRLNSLLQQCAANSAANTQHTQSTAAVCNNLLQQCATICWSSVQQKYSQSTHWGGAALCGTAGGTAAHLVPLRKSCSCHPPRPWVADSQHTCSQQGQQGNVSMPCPATYIRCCNNCACADKKELTKSQQGSVQQSVKRGSPGL